MAMEKGWLDDHNSLGVDPESVLELVQGGDAASEYEAAYKRATAQAKARFLAERERLRAHYTPETERVRQQLRSLLEAVEHYRQRAAQGHNDGWASLGEAVTETYAVLDGTVPSPAAETERLREALSFYAEHETYDDPASPGGNLSAPICHDNGARARAALAPDHSTVDTKKALSMYRQDLRDEAESAEAGRVSDHSTTKEG